MSFGPCRKLPGIFSYRVITRRRISRRACAHARSACAEGSSETFFNVTFVCLFVSSENKIASVFYIGNN